jgi:hypothetical protein
MGFRGVCAAGPSPSARAGVRRHGQADVLKLIAAFVAAGKQPEGRGQDDRNQELTQDQHSTRRRSGRNIAREGLRAREDGRRPVGNRVNGKWRRKRRFHLPLEEGGRAPKAIGRGCFPNLGRSTPPRPAIGRSARTPVASAGLWQADPPPEGEGGAPYPASHPISLGRADRHLSTYTLVPTLTRS